MKYCTLTCKCIVVSQLMTDVAGNPEEERRTEFYQAPWVPEAVGRYVYSKVGIQHHRMGNGSQYFSLGLYLLDPCSTLCIGLSLKGNKVDTPV